MLFHLERALFGFLGHVGRVFSLLGVCDDMFFKAGRAVFVHIARDVDIDGAFRGLMNCAKANAARRSRR